MRALLLLTVALVALGARFVVASEVEVPVHLYEHFDHVSSLLQVRERLASHALQKAMLSNAELRRLFNVITGSQTMLIRSVFEETFESLGEKHSKALFTLLDKDGDNEISMNEWIKGLSDLVGSEPAAPASSEASGGEDTPASSDSNVYELDLHQEKNEQEHHTTKFREHEPVGGARELLLRRGQVFYVTFTVPRTIKASELGLRIGEHEVGAVPKFKSRTWGLKALRTTATSTSDSGKQHAKVELAVYIPADAAVGQFNLTVVSPRLAGKTHGQIVILFNPWSKFDDTHMEEEALLDEYIMEEDGRVWYGDVMDAFNPEGSLDGATSMAWKQHQFEILDEALAIVDAIAPSDRGDVVKVARGISWMCNDSRNKKGVLHGRWKGKYDDCDTCVEPAVFQGSRKIFKQWSRTGKTVRYGQCWVFAGIVTSAARALGIPAATVTNFRSAHDNKPFDRVLDDDHGESVWNFHVWNRVWFKRRDLGEPAGWNTIDATPQERSDGKYQTGPAYEPYLQKNKGHQYDADFVISEVNAHMWLGSVKYNRTIHGVKKQMDTEDIGRFISTKSVGCQGDDHICRSDVTEDYKLHTDPFKEHRFAELRAQYSPHLFETVLEPRRPVLGSPLTVTVRRAAAFSLSRASLVDVRIALTSVAYTGRNIGLIKEFTRTCTLTPQPSKKEGDCDSTTWTVTITPAEYEPFLAQSSSVRVSVEVASKEVETPQPQQQDLPVGDGDSNDESGSNGDSENEDELAAFIEYMASESAGSTEYMVSPIIDSSVAATVVSTGASSTFTSPYDAAEPAPAAATAAEEDAQEAQEATEEERDENAETVGVEYLAERQFSFNVPKVVVTTIPERVQAGIPFKLAIRVQNPLFRPLTKFFAELDFQDGDRTAHFPDLASRRIYNLVTAPIIISHPGPSLVGVSLNSKELLDLFGSVLVQVQADGSASNDAESAAATTTPSAPEDVQILIEVEDE